MKTDWPDSQSLMMVTLLGIVISNFGKNDYRRIHEMCPAVHNSFNGRGVQLPPSPFFPTSHHHTTTPSLPFDPLRPSSTRFHHIVEAQLEPNQTQLLNLVS